LEWNSKSILVKCIINQTATVKAHIVSNVSPNDITRVEFYYNNTLIHTETGYPVNNQVADFWTGTYSFTVPSTGNPIDSIQVWTYDIYNNIAKLSKPLMIDNTLPVANFMLTTGGVPVNTLERESVITLMLMLQIFHLVLNRFSTLIE